MLRIFRVLAVSVVALAVWIASLQSQLSPEQHVAVALVRPWLVFHLRCVFLRLVANHVRVLSYLCSPVADQCPLIPNSRNSSSCASLCRHLSLQSHSSAYTPWHLWPTALPRSETVLRKQPAYKRWGQQIPILLAFILPSIFLDWEVSHDSGLA